MPLPTQEEIETLRGRIRNAIENNVADVFGTDGEGVPLIGADGRETLIRLHESPATVSEFIAWAHGAAQTAGWNQDRIRMGLSFVPYKREFDRREREQRRQAVQARAALRGMRVVNGGRSQESTSVQVTANEEMAPEVMMESDSLALIALGTLLSRRRGRVWYDEFHKRCFCDWTGGGDDTRVATFKRTDAFDRAVYFWLQQIDHRLSKMSMSMCVEVVSRAAEMNVRNEARDWLTSLQWDGQERLHMLLPEAFHTVDDDYTRAVGRCWFVSMAARIMRPGTKVDTMPVFIGPQGRNKSQALAVIGGKWYRAAASSVDSLNFLMELQGCLVFEIPELHSIISSKHGASKIKSTLSTEVDSFRPPYGRNVQDYPRTAVPVGTTNDRGWHVDNTGGRRFWPAYVLDFVDLEYLARNRDQLFAEAARLYSEGASWWDVPEEEQARRIEAERHVDPWEDVLDSNLSHSSLYRGWNAVNPEAGDLGVNESANFGNVVTTMRIGVQWLRMTPEQTSRAARKIAELMRARGWELSRIRVSDRANPIRLWVQSERPDHETDGGTENREVVAVEEDIPF